MEEIKKDLYGVILGGGAGTRLWPLSRELSPKQLLKLFGTDSLIRKTIMRLLKLVPEERISIVTGKRLFDEIRNHLVSGFPALKNINYILEPMGKNTAPAILLAAHKIYRENPDAILGVFPSDHYIEKEDELIEAVKLAFDVARDGYLVTFGLVPERPETGFGYIESGERLDYEGVFKVKRFVEKPDLENAKKYVEAGNYYWNSGMFVFSAKTIIEEGKKYLPQTSEIIENILDYSGENRELYEVEAFSQINPISIDYGVMEKSDRVAVIPVDIGWKDVGSLPAIDEFYEKDGRGNVKIGNVVEFDSKNSIFYTDSRLIAAIGLEDMLVIDTRDATLVCPKDRAQEVSKIVNELKEKGATEYLNHRYSERPWGSFISLESGDNYQVKLLKVYPGMSLSEQLHNHRSEHWIVVRGTVRVIIGDEERILHAGESIHIPVSTKHRLENTGKIDALLIEVQTGEYLGEDDIVRFKDDFGRGKE